jgi:hypothetical protein
MVDVAFYKKRPSEWTRKEVIQFGAPLAVAILAIVIPLIVTRSGSGGGNSSSSSSVNLPKKTYNARLGHAITLTDAYGSAIIELTRIIDPAQGADGDTSFLQNGDRFVAAEFKVSDHSAKPIGGLTEFDNATTVVGSDGQTHSPDEPYSVSECQNFDNGPDQIASGGSVTECVVFQIPRKVSPRRIEVTAGDERGIWTNL